MTPTFLSAAAETLFLSTPEPEEREKIQCTRCSKEIVIETDSNYGDLTCCVDCGHNLCNDCFFSEDKEIHEQQLDGCEEGELTCQFCWDGGRFRNCNRCQSYELIAEEEHCVNCWELMCKHCYLCPTETMRSAQRKSEDNLCQDCWVKLERLWGDKWAETLAELLARPEPEDSDSESEDD
jgi:hypothetical protein